MNLTDSRWRPHSLFIALHDKCPHKGGPLSQGIVYGQNVACPLHGWNIGLEDGHAVAPDVAVRASTRSRWGRAWFTLRLPDPISISWNMIKETLSLIT